MYEINVGSFNVVTETQYNYNGLPNFVPESPIRNVIQVINVPRPN